MWKTCGVIEDNTDRNGIVILPANPAHVSQNNSQHYGIVLSSLISYLGDLASSIDSSLDSWLIVK